MITREEYLKNSNDLHHKYYLEIAQEIGIAPSKEMIEKGDVHLNSIPLKEWDSWALSIQAFNFQRVTSSPN